MIQEHQYRSDYSGGPCAYKWHLTPCGRAREDHAEVDYVTKERDRDMPKRIALLVYVDLDPTPGPFHTEDSALNNLRGILEDQINHYNPVVAFAPDPYQPRVDESRPTIPQSTTNDPKETTNK